MTITTDDCKAFIKTNSKLLGLNSNKKWKRTRKYKDGQLILRDFSNDNSDILTIAENDQEEFFIYKKIVSKQKVISPLVVNNTNNFLTSNWLTYLTQHFSNSCYQGQRYSHQEMLDEYLATIQHGIQHEQYIKKEIYFKKQGQNTFLVLPNMTDYGDAPIYIDVTELKKFGYSPKKKQSAFDFIDENWNLY
jgi:hypothetical protein